LVFAKSWRRAIARGQSRQMLARSEPTKGPIDVYA
jgi:hypothetical protein